MCTVVCVRVCLTVMPTYVGTITALCMLHHVSIINLQCKGLMSVSRRTVTSHALVYEAVQQRAAVVAERRAGVGVDLELVFRPRVLKKEDTHLSNSHTSRRRLRTLNIQSCETTWVNVRHQSV